MTTETATATPPRAPARLLAAATRGVGAVRQAPKPLHPEAPSRSPGSRDATVLRTGVTWLDEPDSDLVLVRRSRAVGLPSALARRARARAARCAQPVAVSGTCCSPRPDGVPADASCCTPDGTPRRCSSAACCPTARPSARWSSARSLAPTTRGLLLWARARRSVATLRPAGAGTDAARRAGLLRPGAQPAAGPRAVRRRRAAPPPRLPHRTSLTLRAPRPRFTLTGVSLRRPSNVPWVYQPNAGDASSHITGPEHPPLKPLVRAGRDEMAVTWSPCRRHARRWPSSSASMTPMSTSCSPSSGAAPTPSCPTWSGSPWVWPTRG